MNYDEVNELKLDDSQKFVKKCFHEESSTCEYACPFDFSLRSFLQKMAKGRVSSAYRDLCDASVFPTLAAYLCDAPCEAACQRNAVDSHVNIRELEKACCALCENEESQSFPIPPKDKKIAVIGAGPAGLSCALGLARKKYSVSVFEKEQGWGGSLRNHPLFEIFNRDFAKQFKNEQVDFHFGCDANDEDLSGYDAVYVASGKNGCDFGLLKSRNSENYSCEKNGWFLGGELCGESIIQGVASGRKLSQLIEAFIQTGRAELIVKKEDRDCTGHVLDHKGEEIKNTVIPEGEFYSKSEAKQEASRCMGCICTDCIDGCEMMSSFKKAPFKLAADICTDANAAPPFSNCEATRQTYSCNMCSYCENVCAEGVDLGKLFRFSREDRYKQDKWVPSFHAFWLSELDFNMSEGFYLSPGNNPYLFFPGCQLSALMPKAVLASYEFLSENTDCGILLACCGAPAVWAGDTDRKEAYAKQLQSAWESCGEPVIITACATCMNMLEEMLPKANTVSLYEILDEKISELEPHEGQPISAAVFDPCSAYKKDNLHASVVSLLKKSGCDAAELESNGKCCGYGGHIKIANRKLYDEISTKQSKASDLPYVVYCANCREVFLSKNKECTHILETVFGKEGSVPTLSEKKQNTAQLKCALMKKLENREFVMKENEWDSVRIIVPQDIRSRMEDKLITDSDIREAIYLAEKNTDYLLADDSSRLASLNTKYVTFWVRYSTGEEGYLLSDVYAHRMKVEG